MTGMPVASGRPNHGVQKYNLGGVYTMSMPKVLPMSMPRAHPNPLPVRRGEGAGSVKLPRIIDTRRGRIFYCTPTFTR